MPNVGDENTHFKSISISSGNQVRILRQEEFNDSFFLVKVIEYSVIMLNVGKLSNFCLCLCLNGVSIYCH